MYPEFFRTPNTSLPWKLDLEALEFMVELFSICPEKSIEKNQPSLLGAYGALRGSVVTLEK